MSFQNPVVGGNTLIRDAIRSPNYAPGSAGWTVNRDGTAEFNNVSVRGDLIVGPVGGEHIIASILAGIPTIAFYDGVHPAPATIEAYDVGFSGGLVMSSGTVATAKTTSFIGGNIGALVYESFSGPLETGAIQVGPPTNQMVKLRATSAGAQDVELGLDLVGTTPDGLPGRLYTVSELKLNTLSADSNYPSRITDGKCAPALTATTIGTSDTNVIGANVVNTYLQDGFAYRATVHVDARNANAGGRLDFKLWDGAVGGSQLGGTNRRWTDLATAGANNGATILIFVWRQVGTGTSGNLNLSAVKAVVTAGAAAVEVNAAYSAIIEQIGDASMIGGL